MSEQLSFKNIKPLEKFNKATATREELIAYIEKLEGQLETLNDALLTMIRKEKAKDYNPTGDLISRKDLKLAIREMPDWCGDDAYYSGVNDVSRLIDNALPAKRQPAKKWVKNESGGLVYHTCPACNKEALVQQTILMTPEEVLSPFCPFCGTPLEV